MKSGKEKGRRKDRRGRKSQKSRRKKMAQLLQVLLATSSESSSDSSSESEAAPVQEPTEVARDLESQDPREERPSDTPKVEPQEPQEVLQEPREAKMLSGAKEKIAAGTEDEQKAAGKEDEKERPKKVSPKECPDKDASKEKSRPEAKSEAKSRPGLEKELQKAGSFKIPRKDMEKNSRPGARTAAKVEEAERPTRRRVPPCTEDEKKEPSTRGTLPFNLADNNPPPVPILPALPSATNPGWTIAGPQKRSREVEADRRRSALKKRRLKGLSTLAYVESSKLKDNLLISPYWCSNRVCTTKAVCGTCSESNCPYRHTLPPWWDLSTAKRVLAGEDLERVRLSIIDPAHVVDPKWNVTGMIQRIYHQRGGRNNRRR